MANETLRLAVFEDLNAALEKHQKEEMTVEDADEVTTGIVAVLAAQLMGYGNPLQTAVIATRLLAEYITIAMEKDLAEARKAEGN